MTENVKIVPATCTQCGGTVHVDPSNTEAKCPFCGTSFVVEKAINNYNIQHATIDHADNVNIDMTGSVKSVLDFFGEQMSEGREIKKEIKKAEAEKDRMITQGFLKMFGIMMAAMMVFGLVAFIFFQVTADAADEHYKYIKNATFLGALHGQNQDDKELVIALYDKNGEKIAYINDGISYVYTSYNEVDSAMKGIGNVEKYTFEGTLVLNFFDLNGVPCLATDDGIIYVCEYLTADDVLALMSYD